MNDLKWLLDNGWTVFSSDYHYTIENSGSDKARHRASFKIRLRRDIDVITDIYSRNESEIKSIFNLLKGE